MQQADENTTAGFKTMDFRTLSIDHVLTHIWGRVNHPENLALPLPDMLDCRSEDLDFFQEQLAETLLEDYSSVTIILITVLLGMLASC